MQANPQKSPQTPAEKLLPPTPHEVALKMIQQGHDDHVIMQDTSLSMKEMKKLRKKG